MRTVECRQLLCDNPGIFPRLRCRTMAILDVLHYPDERLRLKAQPVQHIDAGIRQLADNMLDTMYAEQGIGLAAIQVNCQQRVVVIDLSGRGDDPMRLINPEIIDRHGDIEIREGCLSVPGMSDYVPRARYVRYRYRTLEDTLIEAEAEDLLAVCIQHEIDHLDGKLFIDYLSLFKQGRLRKKAAKQQRTERLKL